MNEAGSHLLFATAGTSIAAPEKISSCGCEEEADSPLNAEFIFPGLTRLRGQRSRERSLFWISYSLLLRICLPDEKTTNHTKN